MTLSIMCTALPLPCYRPCHNVFSPSSQVKVSGACAGIAALHSISGAACDDLDVFIVNMRIDMSISYIRGNLQ